MTEPINGNYGGISFDPSKVTSQRTFKDKNGNIKYELIFNNGQTVTYPKQKSKEASIEYTSYDNISQDIMTLNFANDAFVVGAKDREDLIYLRDSKDCQVNVQDFTSDKTDSVNIYDTGAPNYKSAGNDVIQDRYNDKVSIWNNRTHKYHDYKNSRYVNEDNAKKQF